MLVCRFVNLKHWNIFVVGKDSAGTAIKGRFKIKFFSVIHNLIFKVRNFLPPQSDEPEIFILEQEGEYNGNYGAKNGKPRKFKNFMTFYWLMIL